MVGHREGPQVHGMSGVRGSKVRDEEGGVAVEEGSIQGSSTVAVCAPWRLEDVHAGCRKAQQATEVKTGSGEGHADMAQGEGGSVVRRSECESKGVCFILSEPLQKAAKVRHIARATVDQLDRRQAHSEKECERFAHGFGEVAWRARDEELRGLYCDMMGAVRILEDAVWEFLGRQVADRLVKVYEATARVEVLCEVEAMRLQVFNSDVEEDAMVDSRMDAMGNE